MDGRVEQFTLAEFDDRPKTPVVTDKRETSDGERGIVTMRVEAFKITDADPESGACDGGSADPEAVTSEGDVLMCSFERTVLSLKRDAES